VILPQDFGLRSYAVWPITLKLTLKLNKSQYTTYGSNRFPYNLKNSLCAAVEGTKVSLVVECMLGDLRTMIHTRMHIFKDGQTPYSYPSALFMMLFIAKGVKGLHGNGILQIDLKASNILVGIRVEMSNWVPEGWAELVDLLDIN
jgi:serine/threonine protein kinase